MSGYNVRAVLDRLERMKLDMQRIQRALEDYHNQMRHSIDVLESEGLPHEFVKKFRAEHEQRLSKYFDDISKHMEKDTIPYVSKVIKTTTEQLRSM